jgi:hypothetical protein
MSTPTTLVAGDTWHRVDVCTSRALARTRVSLIGVLDVSAIETIDDAVHLARCSGHAVSFALDEISSITPDALATLLSRG